jgi:hypothetical protein
MGDSRIKDILIELPGYTFSHKPSGDKKSNERYIGRKNIISKIQSIIVNSETKSGAYLVTGFRGMGKTSVVNKAINDLYENRINFNAGGFLMMFVILIFFSLIDTKILERDPFSFDFLIKFILPIGIIIGTIKFNENSKSAWGIQNIQEAFFFRENAPMQKSDVLNLRLINLSKSVVGFLTIHILTVLSQLLIYKFGFGKEPFETRFNLYLFFLLIFLPYKDIHQYSSVLTTKLKNKTLQKFKGLIVLITYIFLVKIVLFTYLTFYKVEKLNGLNFFLLSSFATYFLYRNRKRIIPIIQGLVNYGNIVPVKINLGKDNLEEKDILKFIAKSLQYKYKWVVNPSNNFSRLLWAGIKFFFIYFICISLYFNTNSHAWIGTLKNEIGVHKYLPSQYYAQIITKKDNSKMKSSDSLTLDTAFLAEEVLWRNIEDMSKASLSLNYYKLVTGQSDNATVKPLAGFIRYLDYQIASHYFKILTWFDEITSHYILSVKYEGDIFSTWFEHEGEYPIIPIRIDYLFIFFLFATNFAINSFMGLRVFGVRHKHNLDRLNFLVDRLEAENSKESAWEGSIAGGIASFLPKFLKSSRQAKKYTVLDEKEIETELIGILDDINRVPSISYKPKFVFIFDELDKVEHGSPEDIELYKLPFFQNQIQPGRRRQESMGKLLANMKHFFNTANGKFIFIAGREMYDASIAEVSDRDSLFGSLFDDVIYVGSFFSDDDDGKAYDISSMCEAYIAQFLVPEDKNNSTKFIFIKNFYDKLKKKTSDKNYTDDEIRFIILTLKNFVAYISYKSNGAPKKIIKLLEDYIYPVDKEEFDILRGKTSSENPSGKNALKNEPLLIGEKHGLYLKFTEKDQHIFAFSNYIFTPFLYSASRYSHDFGDKLLVSTSFLLSHLYKFHKSGFSYATLELTPEILAIYRAPNLRSYIERLMRFFQQNHIRTIENGLFQLKFSSKIEKEIEYISKISEKDAAALNFTLDETVEIKKLYEMTIHHYLKLGEASNFNVISQSYASLGDLYYYDGDYNQAQIYYSLSTTLLKDKVLVTQNEIVNGKKKQILNIDFLFSYIKNELKRGLSFERQKSYNEALNIYMGINTLSLSLVKLGFSDKTIVFSNKLLYQSFLAAMQLQEKESIAKVTKTDLSQLCEDIWKLTRGLLPEQKIVLLSELWNKIGDMLYYRNGVVFGDPSTGRPENVDSFYDSFKRYIDKKKNKVQHKHINFYPVSALMYYASSVNILFTYGFSEKFSEFESINACFIPDFKTIKTNIDTIFNEIKKQTINPKSKKFPLNRASVYSSLANSISDVADCLIPIAFGNSEIDLKIFDKETDGFAIFKANPASSTDCLYSMAIKSLFVSGKLYLIAGKPKEYADQLLKILYVLIEIASIKKQSNFGSLSVFFNYIFQKLIEHRYRSFGFLNYVEEKRLTVDGFKNIIDVNNNGEFKHPHSISFDINEALALQDIFNLKTKTESGTPNVESNSYAIYSSTTNRILQLYVHCVSSFRKYKKEEDEKIKVGQLLDLYRSYNQMLKILYMHEPSYLYSYIWLAHALEKLSQTSELIEVNSADKESTYNQLIDNEKHELDHSMLASRALMHYHWVKDTHNLGNPYNEFISRMYYLEDDFNDKTYHFNAAMERAKITSGFIDDKIKELKESTSINKRWHNPTP